MILSEQYKALSKPNFSIMLELLFSPSSFNEIYLHLGHTKESEDKLKYSIRYATFSFMEPYEVLEVPIEQSIAEKIEEILCESKISIIPQRYSMGLDGHSFILKVNRGFNKIEIRWWCEPDEEWAPLGELVELIFSQLPKKLREY
ncbi:MULTISPECIES: hypothetical protein [unclassified Brevibacillus]|uniref:hypothetical protein n=1 Tax=unclassified Brevibacillus TaxID=2684853 RepID=UPI0035671AD7